MWKQVSKKINFKNIILLIFVLIIGAIVIFDMGNFNLHDSGAGDIWWTEIDSMF